MDTYLYVQLYQDLCYFLAHIALALGKKKKRFHYIPVNNNKHIQNLKTSPLK